jgi:acyl-coenzyme A thioesterase PaaI-like protein
MSTSSATLRHDLSNPHLKKFIQRISNPVLQRLFLLSRLPAVWFMGARIQDLQPEYAKITLPYGWRSKNPFRSTYFAAQAAAAELATGLLMAAHLEGRGKISMLVTHMEADFLKKATDRTTFTCDQSTAIIEAIQRTLATGEGQKLFLTARGVQRMADGSEVDVSKFTFEWSIKAKAKG